MFQSLLKSDGLKDRFCFEIISVSDNLTFLFPTVNFIDVLCGV